MLAIMNNDCSGQSIAETLPDEAWQFYDAAVTIGRDGRLRRPRVAPHLYVANVAGKGRGVFCEVSIAAHEVIEIAPVVVLSPDEIEHVRKTRLKEYYFEFWDTYCLAFGVASLFNHCADPNIAWQAFAPLRAIRFYALRKIAAGEELCFDYGPGADHPELS